MNVASSASQSQLSGTGVDGAPVLSVLAKRSFRWHGSTLVEPVDAPLLREPVSSNDDPELLLADMDVYAFKPKTDVVVLGSAHPPRACTSFEVSVRVGDASKRVLVLGRRHILRDGSFSDPQPTAPTKLGYEEAFGGTDAVYLAREGHPLEGLRSLLDESVAMLDSNPYAYPRNPCGKGFAVTPRVPPTDDVAGALPLFEDPGDRLTPARRFAGDGFDWVKQPMPAGLGWFGLGWFPRCVSFGIVPEMSGATTAREVELGLMDPAVLDGETLFCEPAPSRACGASPGLSVPYLRGGETIVLEHLSSRSPTIELRLPAPPTRMRVDGRKGKMLDVEPVLSTVLIEPDAEQVTLVWRGTGRALRPYFDEELSRMPFEVTW